MFKHICVPVDNSDYSNRAIDLAVELGRACGARLTGIHVYAAGLHDYRFKQMEYTLPDEYKDEHELERQRKIHDSLIAMGLQLISDSYLDVIARRAEAAGLAFERKMVDGKHYKALGRPLRAVAVYDPYLHYAMFNGIVGVLNEKASKIFRFKEQEQLHEEIIDTGLAKIYQSHLEIGRKLAAEDGVDLALTLLDGKCFEQMLTFARKEAPWLLVLGRIGVHSAETEEDLAVAKLRAERQAATAICSVCGYTVRGPHPVVTCPVCRASADKFQVISREVVEAIATQEGGIAEEEPMPGVRVKWSADARDALREVTDAYLRRRAKARIEKYARSRKIPVITCQWALPMIEETVGREKLGAGWDTLLARTRFEPAQAPATGGSGNGFVWTEEATARLNRVPAGFMRDMTREEVECVATDKGVTAIDVAVCEEGIGHARETMNEVIAGYVSNKKPR